MNRIISSLIVLMISAGLYAQPGARREMVQDRVEAQRIAFITQKLQLTPDEAAKFWPLYNEHKQKQRDLRRSEIPEGGVMNMSDTEAEKLIAKHFTVEENLLKLKREYYEKMKSAIPARKIARLAGVEMEFNRTMLEQIREKMQKR